MKTSEEIIKHGDYITQRILSFKDRDGLLVIGQDLRDYYEYNRNPEKGETITSELERWIKFIRETKNIFTRYDYETDTYRFQRLTQL